MALARALAISPKVLLLDEPLSALDAKVRSQLRDEIRRVQLEVGITTLFVTHDQEEALAIADRVGVMRSGRLEQLDAPTAVYANPATPFVAEFVGLTNKLPARVTDGEATVLGQRIPLADKGFAAGPALALVRPEAVRVRAADTAEGVPATVLTTAFLGAISRLTLEVTGAGDHPHVIAQLPTADALEHPPGSSVRVLLRPDPVLVTAP